uniref:UBX domain-containing protein n=1 Tax=Vannella robusta TaxID=1487602 RepID=A0A7S4I220_9EUKA|mmetsp:Transcript_19308/g.24409  ORF Transcript_19308/g.24409 Transcript_19308/m.24409 type:complete len:361 (+) Transcript_19308:15-1097(+)
MSTNHRFEPLLRDMQNLISCETKGALNEEERKRRELLDYSVSFCSHPAPEIEPIFDFHYKKNGHRTILESPCDCGFGHFLNGKEYDWVVKFVDIPVGVKRDDHPETVLQKALADHSISSSYELAEKYSNKLRAMYPNFRDLPPEVPSEPQTNSSSVPFVPLALNKHKKRKPKTSEASKSVVESKKEVVEQKTSPTLAAQSAPSTPAAQSAPRTETSKPSGMEEYRLRQKEKMRKQQEETKKKEQFIQDKRNEMDKQRVVIRREQLPMFGVSDVAGESVLFVVNGVEVGSMGFEMAYSHTISHLRVVLDKLLQPTAPYRLILTSISRGMPKIISDQDTLQQAGVTPGGNLIMIPDVSPKFP